MLRPRERSKEPARGWGWGGVDGGEGYHWLPQLSTCRVWQREPGAARAAGSARWLGLGCEHGMRGWEGGEGVGQDSSGIRSQRDGAGLCRLGFTLRAPGSHAGMGEGVREEGTAL